MHYITLFDERKMNSHKRDLAAVLVRFAGLYFTYLAVKQIAAIGYFTWVVSTILDDASEGIRLSEKISISTALPGAISFFISAGVAYYLLRKGNWVIEFLSKETDKPQPTE